MRSAGHRHHVAHMTGASAHLAPGHRPPETHLQRAGGAHHLGADHGCVDTQLPRVGANHLPGQAVDDTQMMCVRMGGAR